MEQFINSLAVWGAVVAFTLLLIPLVNLASRLGEFPTEEEARQKIFAEHPELKQEDLTIRKETESGIAYGGGWGIGVPYSVTRTYLECKAAGVSIQIQEGEDDNKGQRNIKPKRPVTWS